MKQLLIEKVNENDLEILEIETFAQQKATTCPIKIQPKVMDHMVKINKYMIIFQIYNTTKIWFFSY